MLQRLWLKVQEIVRLASGSMTAEEMTRFEAWLAGSDENRSAFENTRALWRSLENRDDRVVALRRKRPIAVSAAWGSAIAALVGEVRGVSLPDGTRRSWTAAAPSPCAMTGTKGASICCAAGSGSRCATATPAPSGS